MFEKNFNSKQNEFTDESNSNVSIGYKLTWHLCGEQPLILKGINIEKCENLNFTNYQLMKQNGCIGEPTVIPEPIKTHLGDLEEERKSNNLQDSEIEQETNLEDKSPQGKNESGIISRINKLFKKKKKEGINNFKISTHDD